MKLLTTLLAACSVFLTACSSLNQHTPSVVGRWSETGMNCIWEFRTDGAVWIYGGDGSMAAGRYALLGEDRIAVDFHSGTKASAVQGIVISPRQLTLIPDKGEKTVFERVK